ILLACSSYTINLRVSACIRRDETTPRSTTVTRATPRDLGLRRSLLDANLPDNTKSRSTVRAHPARRAPRPTNASVLPFPPINPAAGDHPTACQSSHHALPTKPGASCGWRPGYRPLLLHSVPWRGRALASSPAAAVRRRPCARGPPAEACAAAADNCAATHQEQRRGCAYRRRS